MKNKTSIELSKKINLLIKEGKISFGSDLIKALEVKGTTFKTFYNFSIDGGATYIYVVIKYKGSFSVGVKAYAYKSYNNENKLKGSRALDSAEIIRLLNI